MMPECLDERGRGLAAETLEDRRLIERHHTERARIELVEPIIVADVDAGSRLRLLADHARIVSPSLGPPGELARDGKAASGSARDRSMLQGRAGTTQAEFRICRARYPGSSPQSRTGARA